MSTHEVREKSILMTDQERSHIAANGLAQSDVIVPMNCLSKRELQVAHKIMEGHSNKVIASELFISERTVKFHCANIYKKLNISNRTALIANCFRTLYHEAVTS
ncbi:hypothetical protein D210916BOD24_28240 [Alteromonas sp. D210916BOD_24]|uniref:helix-turn-helix domain-containing protein n=1 Tax=Alteromonas sp. D210916BOD_24 TaxID=3157618 RepID=UPI00399CA40F